MSTLDLKASAPVDSQSIRSRELVNGDTAAKQRTKSASGRRPSHGSATASGVAAGSSPTNGTAKKVSHVPCKFYRQGVCQAGSSCPFSHDTEAVSQAVCKYFQKGNCKFGSKCALAHITPDGRRVNTKKDKPAGSKQQHQHQHQHPPPAGAAGPASTPTIDGPRPQSGAQNKTPASSMATTPLASKSVSGSFVGSYFVTSKSAGAAGTSTPAVSIGSPRLAPAEEPKLTSSVGSSSSDGIGLVQPSFLAAPPIGSPGGLSGGIISPLMAGTVTSHSSSARSSFSFNRAAAGSTGARSSSFRSAAFGESQLFAGQRVGSMSRVGSAGSASIWSDRSKNPLAYEGSAIMDDDDEEDDGGDFEEGFEEDLVPPSLSDLLTPQERERRNSRHSTTNRPTLISSPNPSELWSAPRTHRPSAGQQARVLEPIGTPDKAASTTAPDSSSDGSATLVGLGVCGSTSSSGNGSDTYRSMSSH